MIVPDGHYPAEILALRALGLTATATAASATGTAVPVTPLSEYPTSSLQRFGFAIVLFFPLVAFIVVVLRVYSRVSTKQFGIDDGLIVAAMVLSIGETATTYMFMRTNFIGIHVWDIPPNYNTVQAGIWNYAVQVLYNPILAIVKTSMLMFLLKLGSHKPGVRWSIHALNTLNISLMIAIFLVVIFQCTPIRYNWDTTVEGGHCVKQGIFYVSTAALTIFTDILNLALPFWVFLDLKMPLRVKVALLFVFLLGGVVTIVGVVRLVFIYRGFFQPPGHDVTHSLGFVTSAIEINLAIICASAPSLRGLIRNWFPHFFSSNRPSDYYDRYAFGYGGRSGPGHNPYGSNAVATNATGRRARDGGAAGGGGLETNVGAGAAAGAGGGGGRRHGAGMGGSFALRDLKGASKTRTAVNSSPTASEEEIMTYNGIVRTTNVRVQYDQGSERKGSASRDHSRDRGSSTGVRTSISGSL